MEFFAEVVQHAQDATWRVGLAIPLRGVGGDAHIGARFAERPLAARLVAAIAEVVARAAVFFHGIGSEREDAAVLQVVVGGSLERGVRRHGVIVLVAIDR